MTDEVPPNANATNEKPKSSEFLFRLYITGATSRSSRAISNARKILEQDLAGRYDLEIIDIYLEPLKAKEHQIVAAPTLVRVAPGPARRVIGDLSDETKVRRIFEIANSFQGVTS